MNIAIIPARGGSKRIPHKNIKDFNGKPIIAYSIEKAIQSELFEAVIVSTDSEEIAEVSLRYGAKVPFLRPKELSDDFTAINQVISHALKTLGSEKYKYVCCIFATAPLLQTDDLSKAYKLISEGNFKFIFSGTPFPHPIERSFKRNPSGKGLQMLFPEKYNSRSQDLDEYFHDAGQFYWGKSESWIEEAMNFDENSDAIILPAWRVQDIDTPEDWERAEVLSRIIES